METQDISKFVRSLYSQSVMLVKNMATDLVHEYVFLNKSSDKLATLVYLPLFDKCVVMVTSSLKSLPHIYATFETKSITTLKRNLECEGFHSYIQIAKINL